MVDGSYLCFIQMPVTLNHFRYSLSLFKASWFFLLFGLSTRGQNIKLYRKLYCYRKLNIFFFGPGIYFPGFRSKTGLNSRLPISHTKFVRVPCLIIWASFWRNSTRSRSAGFVPAVNLSWCNHCSVVRRQGGFSYAAPLVWNSLSRQCRACDSVFSFKKLLKTELFAVHACH